MIVVVGLSHKSAPLEVRERLAIPRDGLPDLIERLRSLSCVGEAVVLSTCNRVEIYAAPPSARQRALKPPSDAAAGANLEEVSGAIAGVLASIGTEAVRPHLGRVHGPEAVQHLFRVAASLDSLVIGEPQILGQLKDAIELAREVKSLGPTLGKAMHHAVRVGKRVRSETQIGAGQVSISSVAIDLARQIFGELDRRTVLLVGAGEMAEAASKVLIKAGARLVVVNRSPERGAALAQEFGGEARPWAELEAALVAADIVISSTSSKHHVLTKDLVKRASKARRGRSLFLIDIAVPRDIEPAVNRLDNVFLYDIDDLSQIVAQSLEGRAAEAAHAEAIVVAEARGFEAWSLERSMAPTIIGLRARTRGILTAEVERSLSGKLKHLGAAEREALAIMVDAATNKLLHAPVTRLKALAADARSGDYVEALRDLFELPDVIDVEAHAPDGAHAADGAVAESKHARPAPAGERDRKADGPRAHPPSTGRVDGGH